MWRAIVDPDFRITLLEELRSKVQVGDKVIVALDAAGRRTVALEAQTSAILAETAGLGQDRTDSAADGVVYVNALRRSPAASPVLDEMIEFLGGRPTAERIAAFRIPAGAQARLAELLDKNREDGLSEAENAELDWYE